MTDEEGGEPPLAAAAIQRAKRQLSVLRQGLIPVVPNHFDCICQAASDSIPAMVVISEDIRYQRTEQFNQYSTWGLL